MADFEHGLMSVPALKRLEALMPRGLDSVAYSVRHALGKDDYSRALELSNERYARGGPGDYDAALTYACVLVGRELVGEARGVLRRTLEAHPGDAALCALLADALVHAGEVDQAATLLDTIDTEAIERAQVSVFCADVYLDLGDEDAAIMLYQRAVDARVDDPEPAIRLGQLLQQRGEVFGAAEAFEYAARLTKTRTGLWEMTAELWQEVGEERRALLALERVLELTGGDADTWIELGYRFAETGQLDKALSALAEAIDIDPFATDALLVRGHVLLEIDRPEEAMAAFQKVEGMGGERAATQRGMAEAALLIGDVALADERSRRAVELRPDDPEAQFVRGRALQQYGRHDQAIDALDHALAHRPDQVDYLAAKALSLGFLGRLDEARAMLTEALACAQSHAAQLPASVDLDSWNRLHARMDDPQRAWFKEKLDLLVDAAS